MPFFKKYEPLDDPKTSIRILEVLPGADSELVTTYLKQAVLSANPNYFTISYRWDISGSDKLIWVNGQPCAVSRDIWSMLRHVRKSDEAIFMWIDILCIDQSNALEKGYQVQLMGSIYSNAIETLIWLGDKSHVVRSALRYFDNWDSKTASNCDEGELAAIRAFCQIEYWNRAWIRQEILKSNTITIRCGDVTGSWNKFTQCCQQTSLRSSLDETNASIFLDHTTQIDNTEVLRPRMTLQSLVERYGISACSEVRDRIYALFSLASDYGKDTKDLEVLNADYTISVDRLLQNVIRFCQPNDQGTFRSYLRKVLEIDMPKMITETFKTIHAHYRPLEFSYLGILGKAETISESPLEFSVFSIDSSIEEHRRERFPGDGWTYEQDFISFGRMLNPPDIKHESPPLAPGQIKVTPLTGDMIYQIPRGGDCVLLLRPHERTSFAKPSRENFRLKPPGAFYATIIIGQHIWLDFKRVLRISPQISWLTSESPQQDLSINGFNLAKTLYGGHESEALKSLQIEFKRSLILKNAVPSRYVRSESKSNLNPYDTSAQYKTPSLNTVPAQYATQPYAISAQYVSGNDSPLHSTTSTREKPGASLPSVQVQSSEPAGKRARNHPDEGGEHASRRRKLKARAEQ